MQFKCFTFEPHKDRLVNKCIYCGETFVFKIAEEEFLKGNFELSGKAFIEHAKECCEHARKHEPV